MEIWNYTALELGAALREGACTVPEGWRRSGRGEGRQPRAAPIFAGLGAGFGKRREALQRRIFRQEPASPLPVSRF